MKKLLTKENTQHIITAGVFFYTGLMIGIMTGYRQCPTCVDGSAGGLRSSSGTSTSHDARFATGLSKFASGMTFVEREEFSHKFDMGVPIDPNGVMNSKVLLIHAGDKAIPTFDEKINIAAKSNTAIPLINNVDHAVENCDIMNVILTDPESRRQCLAIMGQYESNHLQKFIRIPDNDNIDGSKNYEDKKQVVVKVDPALPLRHVNRFVRHDSILVREPPTEKNTMQHWNILSTLLSSYKDSLARLKPIASKVVNKQSNTITVMVCSKSQIKLLTNTVCSHRSQKMSFFKNFLIIASDKQTKDAAEALGFHTFFDEPIVEKFPFMIPGLVKIRAAQLVNALGYNILFQEVSTIWYRNPIPYLHNDAKNKYFDLIFQDDGARGALLAPYDANAGFYYAKYNNRTRYFFSSLLVNGDIIHATNSDQISFANLLSDHVEKYELRVRSLNIYDGMFLSGHHYHRKGGIFKNFLIKKSLQPYIFHLTEARSKTEQIEMLEQLGNWYLNEQCTINNKKDDNRLETAFDFNQMKLNEIKNCCTQEAAFKCHHKDRPSIKPCKDSPSINPNGKSFW